MHPFLPAGEFERSDGRLGLACAALSLFEVRLARFDTFRHHRDSYTLWLKPEPEEPLIDLQRALGRPAGREKRRGRPGAAFART